MASVELAGLAKSFHGHAILHQLDLEIADKEFLVLVGPSGCGKSTLLRMIAGLEEPTAGEIRIGGRPVTDVPPSKREIAMVFQDYALYPHMTVEQNMSFGLRLRKLPKDQIDRRVREAARLLQIEPLLARTPRQLSGGQRQRVAIGRAIVRQPQVFLFDEPLSNLDAKLREEMRVEIAKLHQRLQTTVVYVTHDQVEAMTLATRIAIMNAGRLQQIGTPQEVFNAPANLFVAGFIGSPTMNFIEGRFEPGGDRARFASRAFTIPLARPSPGEPIDAVLGMRPESIAVETPGPGYSEAIPATIEVVELLGHRKNVHLRLGDDKILAIADAGFAGQPGDRVPVHFKTSAAHLFVRESGQRIS